MFNTYLKSLSNFWENPLSIYKAGSSFRFLLLSTLTGVFVGLVASAFFLGLEGLRHIFLVKLAGQALHTPSGERLFSEEPGKYTPWLIPLFTTCVGLLTGWLVMKFIPNAQQDDCTDGTDSVSKTFHQDAGMMRPLVPLIKGTTSILTIASGGSAGREGPITQIGAGIGSWLSYKLNLSPRERRILLLAGAGAGLGAIFRAPLGGAITGVEIIYTEDFESEALLPSIISSVIAYTIFTMFYGSKPLFDIPQFSFHPQELIFYLLLAVFCALTGFFYVKTFYFLKRNFFQKIKKKTGLIITTGLGGLIMGCLGMVFPSMLCGGYGLLELAILGKLSITIMLGLLIGKTIATSITIGSEMSGGMFAPALFVGGMSGGIMGQLGQKFFPQLISNPGGFVLVGMAAFFAGVGSAPVGPFILVSELVQNYDLLAPLMLASAICILLTKNISIYENQLENKFQSPAHSGELFVDLLQSHTVNELLSYLRQVYVVSENMNFSDFKQFFSNTNQHYFPVKNAQGELTGIFSSTDFRNILFEEDVEDLVLVKDIALSDIISTTPSEDLNTVMNKFTQKNIDALPVVKEDDYTYLLGMLRRREVIDFYNRELKSIKSGKTQIGPNRKNHSKEGEH